jgi:NADP-dependent 3-hydroxy acid dehydrogenase YdfG
MSKQQKVWFITGSSRGFGRVWAEAALKRGDKVAATARDTKSLQPLVETYGDAVLPLALDVTDRNAVFEAVGQAYKHFGKLDVILSNAGYGCMGAIEEIPFEDIKANFETNVFGTLSVIQAALPYLRAQKSGHIITVSSIGGIVVFPTGGIYNATKFAVEAFSEALAGEVAGLGIKVTILEPGSFKTGFRESSNIVPPTAEYEGIRKAVFVKFKPEMAGDPAATGHALLQLVDSDAPPLRLILGKGPLHMFRQTYASRLETWEKWDEVSTAAH